MSLILLDFAGPAWHAGAMDLTDLLRLYDMPRDGRIKLYRHSDDLGYLQMLRREGKLNEYQALQSRKLFECDRVGVFLGLPQNRGLFAGWYDVEGVEELPDAQLEEQAQASDWWSDPRYCPPRLRGRANPWWHGSRYRYDLRPVPDMAELADRLVVDFGSFSRASARWLGSFERLPVVEIRAPGRREAFPGFDQVRLTYPELCTLVAHPDANPDWQHALGSVAGIYAICVTAEDPAGTLDGRRLYIGSASGRQNLWQRWSDYAASGHGGNKLLRELLERRPELRETLQFSILQTAPLTMSPAQILRLEQDYKQKLGTIRFGLNAN